MKLRQEVFFPKSDHVNKNWDEVYLLQSATFSPFNEADEAFDLAKKEFKENFSSVEIGVKGYSAYLRMYKKLKEQFMLRLPSGYPIPMEIIKYDFKDEELSDKILDKLAEHLVKLNKMLDEAKDIGTILILKRQIRKIKDELKDGKS